MTDLIFVEVARVEDLPEGGLLAVEADGEPLCLAKVDGQIYACTDNCTHISGPLSRGRLEGTALTCPLHGSQFDVCTGRVLRGPARQPLPSYPVRVTDGVVYVGLPPVE